MSRIGGGAGWWKSPCPDLARAAAGEPAAATQPTADGVQARLPVRAGIARTQTGEPLSARQGRSGILERAFATGGRLPCPERFSSRFCISSP